VVPDRAGLLLNFWIGSKILKGLDEGLVLVDFDLILELGEVRVVFLDFDLLLVPVGLH
jgi:hypothetical protein